MSRGRSRCILFRLIVGAGMVFIPLAVPSPDAGLHAQVKETSPQGGTLVFGPAKKVTPNDSSFVQTIGLEAYIGQPLKALQLQVISSGALRLRKVERGGDIGSGSAWNLSHVIVHGRAGVDTAKVVIFGLGMTSLPPSEYSELLVVTYDVVPSAGGATALLSLVNVLGALTRGENARVVAGPPQTISLHK